MKFLNSFFLCIALASLWWLGACSDSDDDDSRNVEVKSYVSTGCLPGGSSLKAADLEESRFSQKVVLTAVSSSQLQIECFNAVGSCIDKFKSSVVLDGDKIIITEVSATYVNCICNEDILVLLDNLQDRPYKLIIRHQAFYNENGSDVDAISTLKEIPFTFSSSLSQSVSF